MSDDASKKLKVAEAQEALTTKGNEIGAKLGSAEKALSEAKKEVEDLVKKVAGLLQEAGGREASGRRSDLITNAAVVQSRAEEGAGKAKGAREQWSNAQEDALRGILRILSADS